MSESFGDKIGNNIRKQREKCGLTQEQVAERMRIKRETYNTIENGKRALKDHEIVQLADILKTDCDYILRGVQTKKLSISESTGLNEDAISKLIEFNHYGESPVNFNRFSVDVRKKLALETLICYKDGELLYDISHYLCSDYSHIYIRNDTNDELGEPQVFDGGIFLKNNRPEIPSVRSYSRITPQELELAELIDIINSLKTLKKTVGLETAEGDDS